MRFPMLKLHRNFKPPKQKMKKKRKTSEPESSSTGVLKPCRNSKSPLRTNEQKRKRSESEPEPEPSSTGVLKPCKNSKPPRTNEQKKKRKKKSKPVPVPESSSTSVLKPCKNSKPHTTDEQKKRNTSKSESSPAINISTPGIIIKEGDIVDISRLLSTEHRNYLVTNNDDRVMVDHLKGKFVAIYFVSLTYHGFEIEELAPRMALIETYEQLLHKGVDFEVIFVATRDGGNYVLRSSWNIFGKQTLKLEPRSKHEKDPQERFIEFFSGMPWLAIPFSDKESRKRLASLFGFSERSVALPKSILLDPEGLVLSTNAGCCYFNTFGAEGFPFTSERIRFLQIQEAEAAKRPSLQTLLASSDRDFVISNKGDQVLISSLEGKVLCLYLYEDGLTGHTERLKKAYEELKNRGEDFEVVLVYLHFTPNTWDNANEDSFWECFKTMPWLALPFKDLNCMKLARIFKYPITLLGGPGPDPILIIIGSHGSYVEFYGADMLEMYGTAAYPFTREQAAKIKAKELKEITLDSLLDPGVVLSGKDRSQVSVSELLGKKVLLVLAEKLFFRSNKFLGKLKKMYCEKKNTEDEFEVIYISSSREKSSYNEWVAKVPWLVHPFTEDRDYAYNISVKLFNRYPASTCAFAAFGEDGKLVEKTSHPLGGVEGHTLVFPFFSDLEKETLRDLIAANNWDLQYSDDPTYMEEFGSQVLPVTAHF